MISRQKQLQKHKRRKEWPRKWWPLRPKRVAPWMKSCKGAATENLWESHNVYKDSFTTARSKNWQDKKDPWWPKGNPLGKDNTSKDSILTSVRDDIKKLNLQIDETHWYCRWLANLYPSKFVDKWKLVCTCPLQSLHWRLYYTMVEVREGLWIQSYVSS